MQSATTQRNQIITAWLVSLVIFTFCCAITNSHADESAQELKNELTLVKFNFEQYGLKVDDISKIKELGLYQILSGGNAYYTNGDVKYVIFGHLLNAKAKKDLTKIALDKLASQRLSKLPFQDAIVSGNPKGKHTIIVFTDPDCPYCRQLEPELEKLTDVKVYTFLFPLAQLHPRATDHANAIWCSNNRQNMLRKIMVQDYDATAPANCVSPVQRNIELGASLGVNSTPTIFNINGERWSGAASAQQISQWLTTNASPQAPN